MNPKKLLSRYSLSYEEKLRFFITVICALLLCCILLLNLFFWRLLSQKDFAKSRTELFYTSQSIFSRLSEPRSITYNLMANETFQNLLLQSNEETRPSPDKYSITKDIRTIIQNATLTADSSIISVYLFNKQEESLANTLSTREQLLGDLSFEQAFTTLPDTPSPGQWFFSNELNQAIFMQKIFSSEQLKLEYQGVIIFLLNTTFIRNTFENGANFTKDNIYTLSYGKETHITTFNDPDKTTTIQQELANVNLAKQDNKIIKIAGKKYYIVSTENSTFQSAYLVPDDEILKQLIQLEILFILVLLILIYPIYQGIKKISKRLTDPIIELAAKMRNVTDEEDLKALKKLTPHSQSHDEVAILYHGFQDMASQLSQLIEENYKGKILSQEMEFKALQAQLDPHFLYNTLDSIYWLALENDDEKIAQMALSLALLFRKKINNDAEVITLDDELQLVDAYTNIQMIRFENRVHYQKRLELADLTLQLPKFLIQPLVENAFKYAVEKSAKPVEITLYIHETAADIWLEVLDNGRGFSQLPPQPSQSGIGLKNIEARLKLFFGEEATLKIVSEPFVATSVTIKIPKSQIRRKSS